MRIVFVLTYPVHYVADPAEWLRWANRDRRMPGILAEMGVDAELWGVAPTSATHRSQLPGIAPYPIRLFAADDARVAPRAQVSEAMVAAARADPADLFVLIGANGPAGYRLYDRALLPDRRRHAVIVGGDYWSRIVPGAAFVFPESAVQERALARPGPRFWRRPVAPDRMAILPKSIDTARFTPPDPVPPRRWDVIALSRLVRWKRFDELAMLSGDRRVAVIGGGPDADMLRRRYPEIAWLGHVPNPDVPALLSQARMFFHAGGRDYHPRAIVEAMACGLPVAALAGRIGTDVVPPPCGILVTPATIRDAVGALLSDPARLWTMGRAARAHAVQVHGPRSAEAACRTLMRVAAA